MLSVALAAVSFGLLSPTFQRVPTFGNDRVITVERVRAHLEFIASDELEGRGTPSRGVDIACMYVASLLKQWGATPAGDSGSYFQRIPLARTVFDPEKSSLSLGTAEMPIQDFVAGGQNAGKASGPLVYVGHGYKLTKKGIDPYAGIDVKGKIIVVTDGMPNGVSPNDIDRGKDLTPDAAAKLHGAVGVILIPRTDIAPQTVTPSILNPFFSIKSKMAKPAPGIPRIVAKPLLVATLFQGAPISAIMASRGLEAQAKSFTLDRELVFEVAVKEEAAYTQNVIATTSGSDPKLRSEFVGFGAHIDHEGILRHVAGDQIFNGADDNASGTVGLLEIAHAFLTAKPPKRSLLFAWFGAEEWGLEGSKHFVDKPTINLKSLIAFINMDMIGKSKPYGAKDPKYLDLTEPDEVHPRGISKMSSSLEKLVRDVNNRFLKLRFNMSNDESMGSGRMPGGSDHISFFAKGIPTFAWHTGFHEDYHGADDEAEKIDFEKITKIAKTTYACGLELANLRERPVVDKPMTVVKFDNSVTRIGIKTSHQLTATIDGEADPQLEWSVVTPEGGSITKTGLYTAPDKPGRFTVRATSAKLKGVYGLKLVIVDPATPPEVRAALPSIPIERVLQNPGFEDSATGKPIGWHLNDASAADGFIVASSAIDPFEGKSCLLMSNPAGTSKLFGNVRQALDAKPYRGKRIRFRAAVRTESGSIPGRAQLWMRIDDKEGRALLMDNMSDRPITSSIWSTYEIVLVAPDDAETLQIGILQFGNGKTWIDGATFEVI